MTPGDCAGIGTSSFGSSQGLRCRSAGATEKPSSSTGGGAGLGGSQTSSSPTASKAPSGRPLRTDVAALALLPRAGPPIVDFVRPSMDLIPPAKDDGVVVLTFPLEDPFCRGLGRGEKSEAPVPDVTEDNLRSDRAFCCKLGKDEFKRHSRVPVALLGVGALPPARPAPPVPPSLLPTAITSSGVSHPIREATALSDLSPSRVAISPLTVPQRMITSFKPLSRSSSNR